MPRIRELVGFAVAYLFLLLTIGCGGSNRATVSGQATLDGQAIHDGTISFIPAAGTSALASWGKIKEGKYSIPAAKGLALGTNRVEIHWSRRTGKMRPAVPPAPAVEEVLEAIPDRYNSRSELKAEIKPGDNRLDFQLKSK